MDFRNKMLQASERVENAVNQRRAAQQAVAGRGTNALIALHALLAERSNGRSDYKPVAILQRTFLDWTPCFHS